jgi:hypothetical protein
MSCLAKPSGNKGVREPLYELPLPQISRAFHSSNQQCAILNSATFTGNLEWFRAAIEHLKSIAAM